MDEKEMKIEALKQQFAERVAAITAEYENKIADLRVALTMQQQKLDEQQRPDEKQGTEGPLEGTVVDE